MHIYNLAIHIMFEMSFTNEPKARLVDIVDITHTHTLTTTINQNHTRQTTEIVRFYFECGKYPHNSIWNIYSFHMHFIYTYHFEMSIVRFLSEKMDWFIRMISMCRANELVCAYECLHVLFYWVYCLPKIAVEFGNFYHLLWNMYDKFKR